MPTIHHFHAHAAFHHGHLDILLENSSRLNKEEVAGIKEKIGTLSQTIISDPSSELDIMIDINNQLQVAVLKGTKKVYSTSIDLNDKQNNPIENVKDLMGLIEKVSKNPLTKVTPQNDDQGFFDSIKKILQKAWIYYFFVKPNIQTNIKEIIKGKTEEQLKELYIDPKALFVSIKQQFLTESANFPRLFDDQELFSCVNEELIFQLREKGKGQWDDRTISKLNVLSDLTTLKQHSYTFHDTFESLDRLFERLNQVAPMDMPLERLKEIPITDFNKEKMAQLWANILGNLFYKGQLDKFATESNLLVAIPQEHYASRYVLAMKSVPKELGEVAIGKLSDRQTLNQFCHYLNEKQPANVILDLVRQRGNYPRLESENQQQLKPIDKENIESVLETIQEELSLQTDEEDIFEKKIEPKLNWLRRKIIPLGSAYIANNLVYDSSLWPQFLKGVTEHLTREQKNEWTEERVKKIFTTELENLLLFEFHFSPVQMIALRNYRSEMETNKKVKDAPQMDVFDILYGDGVLQEMSHQVSHPNSNLAPKFQADLLFINKVLEQGPKRAKDPKEIEKTKIVLQRILKDESLMKILKANLEDYEDPTSVLKYLPGFLRSIIISLYLPNEKKIEKELFLPNGLSNDTIKFLSFYSEAIRRLPTNYEVEVNRVFEKAEKLINLNKSQQAISLDDRLSLGEIGLINSISRANKNDFFADAEFLGLFDKDLGDKKLIDLKKFTIKSNEVLNAVNEIVQPTRLLETYPNGTIAGINLGKKTSLNRKKAGLSDEVTAYISNGLTHAAKVYHDNGEIYLSNISQVYLQEKISIYDLCANDFWELDIIPLIDPSLHPVLKEVYGENWKQEINKKYQEIEQSLHAAGEKRFRGLKNQEQKRIEAGLADHPFLFKLFGHDIESHQNKTETDYEKLHSDYLNGEPLKEFNICSEFVSKSTAAAMVELNLVLTSEIQNKLEKFQGSAILDKLKEEGLKISELVENYLAGTGFEKEENKEALQELARLLKKSKSYSTEEKALILRLMKKEIFDLPYDKYERFEAIHPGRMVDLLMQHKCVKPVAPAKALSDLIAF